MFGYRLLGLGALARRRDAFLAFHAPLTSDLVDVIGGATASFSRSQAAFSYDFIGGVLVPYSANQPRIHSSYGILIEGQRTNDALFASDLSNGAWAKSGTQVNTTSTTDPFGNASTTIEVEATAPDGTILQSITKASAVNAMSLCIRRILGSDPVHYTLDGGATWTLAGVTSDYNFFEAVQTLENPQIGVRFAASGDKVAIDCIQCETCATGGNQPPPRRSSFIPTTSSAATRNSDNLEYALGAELAALLDVQGTMACVFRQNHAWSNGRIQQVLTLSQGTATNVKHIIFTRDDSSIGSVQAQSVPAAGNSGAVIISDSGLLDVDGETHGVALAWAANSLVLALDGAVGTEDTTLDLPTGQDTLDIGAGRLSQQSLFGYVKDAYLWTNKRGEASLIAHTLGPF